MKENVPHGDSCYSNAISKKISRTVIRVIREIRVLLNIEILIFFRLNIYKGACMSTTIHQTMSYLYLPDSNIFLYNPYRADEGHGERAARHSKVC